MLKGKSRTQAVAVLREQVNIRRYVDQIAAPVPAKEGAGGWLSGSLSEEEAGQLRAHVEGMVKAEKYTDPPAVAPALQREAPAPHATKFALYYAIKLKHISSFIKFMRYHITYARLKIEKNM